MIGVAMFLKTGSFKTVRFYTLRFGVKVMSYFLETVSHLETLTLTLTLTLTISFRSIAKTPNHPNPKTKTKPTPEPSLPFFPSSSSFSVGFPRGTWVVSFFNRQCLQPVRDLLFVFVLSFVFILSDTALSCCFCLVLFLSCFKTVFSSSHRTNSL
jgi:hypothetical protein